MKVYFPNLNGLRHIGCLVVLFGHVEMMKWVYDMDSYYTVGMRRSSHLMIVCFFVLSGFLITYLLIAENEKYKTISIKSFYVRRILRIWPLYFFFIFLGLFVWPNIPFFHVPGQGTFNDVNFWHLAFFYLIVLPNIAVKIFVPNPVPLVGPTWSIGVEEQFYFMWPIIMKYSKNALAAIITVIVVYNIALFILMLMAHGENMQSAIQMIQDIWAALTSFRFDSPQSTLKTIQNIWIDSARSADSPRSVIQIVYDVWDNFVVSTMAFGGLMAWFIYYKKTAILRFFHHPIVDIGTYVLIFFLTFKSIRFPFFQQQVYGFLFAVMILNMASNPKSFVKMENKYFNYMGKISYSFYIFHILGIYIIFKLFHTYLAQLPHQVVTVVAFLLAGLVITLISSVTYKYVEEPILKKKFRFSKIKSGDMAKEKMKKEKKKQRS